MAAPGRACAEDPVPTSLSALIPTVLIAPTLLVIGAAMAAVAGVLLGQFCGVINPYIGFAPG